MKGQKGSANGRESAASNAASAESTAVTPELACRPQQRHAHSPLIPSLPLQLAAASALCAVRKEGEMRGECGGGISQCAWAEVG